MKANSKLGNLTRMLNDDREEQAWTSTSSWRPSWRLILTQCLGFRDVYCSPGIISIKKKKKSHKNPATKQQNTWDTMATPTGKTDTIHDFQMSTSSRPNFCSAPESHDCSFTPTQPSLGGVDSSISQVSAGSPKDKTWQRL